MLWRLLADPSMSTETLRPAPSLLRHDRSVFGAGLPEMRSPARRALARLVMLACGPLLAVEGAERLRGFPEPAIFVFNHSNSFESLAVPAALTWLRGGRTIHFLVDWMFLRLPLAGWVLRQCEPIPVYTKPARWRLFERHRRENAGRPVLDACLERLAAGGSLGIFPEGTRNPDPGRLLRPRRGLGELILRSAVPVVPVGIIHPAARRLGRAPRVGRIVIRIGEPLDLTAERAAPAGESRRSALAREAAGRVMSALSELCGKSYPHSEVP